MGYPDWKGKTVLIAEDEEFNFVFLKEVLSVTGIEVLHASNGQEVLDLVEENNSIDMVLMDIKMPVLNGYEATKMIKQMRPDIPIIVQTAFAMSDEKKAMMDSGCDEYIIKPLQEDAIFETMAKYLK